MRRLIDAVRAQLRSLLVDLQALEGALTDERALGGDPDHPRTLKLQTALATKTETADRLINVVRDLHVELAVADGHGSQPLLEALQKLAHEAEADAEVAQIGEPARLVKQPRKPASPRGRDGQPVLRTIP